MFNLLYLFQIKMVGQNAAELITVMSDREKLTGNTF